MLLCFILFYCLCKLRRLLLCIAEGQLQLNLNHCYAFSSSLAIFLIQFIDMTSSVGNETQITEESDTVSSHSAKSSQKKYTIWQRVYNIITYTPKRCRYDPDKPFEFSTPLNLLFAFAGAFTVANLYYSHPILNKLADDFHVSQERVSLIPTLAQAGYGAGLLFLCPLGDLFQRRPFVLLLVWFTATSWIGLCITDSFPVFCFLSFLTALTTVTPQLMLPLVGDLAPVHRRATALSIVTSGLLLGLLIARLLSGVVTEYTSWRNIYWLAFALQYLILILLWFFLPDYPSTNPSGLNYFKMLWSIIAMLFKHPILVQACLVGFCTSTTFTSYWTTLTFLLAGEPYNFSPLYIGLFALVGIFAMCFGPPYSRLVIDRFVPLFSVIVGELICITGISIGTYTGTFTIAGPIIQAFMLDFGLQSTQIANRTAIYAIEPKARNRVNTAFMVSVFIGQIVGTSVGNTLYAQGGWHKSGSASVGFIGAALCFCFAKGPWEKGWVGWRGGWGIRKRDLGPKEKGQHQEEDAEMAGNTANDEGKDREKMADEMAAEANESGEPKGSPTEKS